MRYLALCCDYDGTLATEGRVLPDTRRALERLIASGRRLVMVTGRELDDLQRVCPDLHLFEYVVAENGALLYHPATGATTALAERPPDTFLEALRERGVDRISVGQVIVATWEPHETTVLETIHDLGLELQVIFNKGAVMILPAGVNKATGLAHALKKMGLSARNTVGVGDAENDHALLAACECSAAVSNALPTLKNAADIVTTADRGAGVAELIEEILRDDLAERESRLTRHHIPLGTDEQGQSVALPPYGERVLLLGDPDTGKTRFAQELLRRLSGRGYTYCMLDVEGTFEGLPDSVSVGDPTRPPTVEEVIRLLHSTDQNSSINLVDLPLPRRTAFLTALAPRLAGLREHSGRPHWVAIDETRHLLPQSCPSDELTLFGNGHSVLHMTGHPAGCAPVVLRGTSWVIALGANAGSLIEAFATAAGLAAPKLPAAQGSAGAALVWRPHHAHAQPFRLNTAA